MSSRKRIAAATLLTVTLLGCGPGDAPYRFFVKSLEIQLNDPREKSIENSMKLLGNCSALPTQIKADLGLMKSDLPGMQSIPRHIRIDPSKGGWITEINPSQTNQGPYSIRIRGARPQELQFQPGNYIIAINGSANCSGETADSKLPFVYYSEPKEFSPGKEVNLVAQAFFADGPLGCSYNPTGSGNFVRLTLVSLTSSGPNPPPSVQLFSPTAPSLSGDYSNCNSTDRYLGPLPNRGRYFVRYRDANNAVKCYKFEGLGASTPLTGEEITPCPAVGPFGI